jgi:CBS domain-containing protein
MAERHLGAVPVLEGDAVVGIVTDGDLLRREELGTDTVCAIDPAGDDCAKSHGRSARDVMTPDVVTIVEDTTLADISELMAIRRIKRVPVLRAGRLVGIVSRSDIVRALVARPEGSHGPLVCDDDIVRFQVFETLMGIPGASAWQTSVGVSKGVVRLDGVVDDETAREPSRLAVERLPCVVAVDDHRSILLPY